MVLIDCDDKRNPNTTHILTNSMMVKSPEQRTKRETHIRGKARRRKLL